MLKLARWTTTHRKYVVLGWVLLLVAVNVLARSSGTTYSNNFTLPNSDAQRASDLLKHSFPAQAGDRDSIVFAVRSGTVRDRPVRERVGAMLDAVARLPHVSSVISPYAGASAGSSTSADGRIAFATVVFAERADQVPRSAAERVVRAARAASAPGLQVELGGQAIEMTQRPGFGLSTAVGLMAAIVVLLLTFGSLIAMGLPIVTALFGLGTGLGAIALFTHLVPTPNFSSELAAMIGLGVGIDYALFILTRFREAYATPGPGFANTREAVVRSMDTAGRAVLFAGCTVVIALLGMMLLGISFLYGVALSASIAVLLVMAASLTLLPALLTFAGTRLARPSRRARRRAADAPESGGGAWLRWSAVVQRRPWAIATIATLTMLLIAAPAMALRLGSSDASNDPASETTHRAYELLARGFGRGFNGPLLVVAKLPHRSSGAGAPARSGEAGPGTVRSAASAGATAAALERLRAWLAAAPGVASVAPVRINPAGNVAAISVFPRSSPQAFATTRLVQRLRAGIAGPLMADASVTVYVGGVTAGGVDFATTLGHKLPLFIGVVVLLSALLLMLVFRSLVIPIQAAVMNLLSIGAALGVIVVVFQWGWLHALTGIEPGPVESFIPVMLFAIVFGLSMDYEVFLVSRIHERWTHTRESSRSVAEGLALTGRVVSAAAAIMVCVFLSFILGEDRVIKEFGLSLASAVFLDALVIRCLLLPAVLHIVGRRTWMLPAWLAGGIPQLNIEGAALPGRPPAIDAELSAAAPPRQAAAGAPGASSARSRSEIATEGAEG
jgi:putative drug exporter of the RND superfamily